jgi:UDP-glucose:(heptosyl)LPS alpha-1,3-glucosyltransferase
VQGFDLTTHQDVLRVGRGLKRVYDEVLAPTRSSIDRWLRSLSRADRRLLELEARMLAPSSARVLVANSNAVARELVDRAGVDATRVEVIWNGIDGDAWNPHAAAGGRAEMRARFGMRADERVVLHLGTGFRRKGLDVTLRAFAALARREPRVRLLVVGRDGAVWRYRLLALRLGVASRVTFAGSFAATPALYGAADVVSAPSRYDPFANTILESLACGVPAIHPRCAGASELLCAAGLDELVLADPEDAPALAAHLERALDAGGVLAARCRAAAERRPQRAVVDDYESLYRRLTVGATA